MKNILIVLILILRIKLLALNPDSTYHRMPENWALVYKELDIKTPDGFSIKTWFFPAQSLQPADTIRAYYMNPKKKPYFVTDENAKPTIIICNGDAGNMADLLGLVMGYIEKDFNVVTFDWRGFGQSQKFTINKELLCYSEFLIDYNSVINEVVKFKEVDPKKIGLFGFSTGAYLSFAVAFENNNVKCFIGRGLMTNFEDFLEILYVNYPEKKDHVKVPLDYPIDLYPINIAPKFTKPTFLIVGSEDNRTPVFMSQKIYEILNCKKELWIVPGAAHGGAKGPEFINIDSFIAKTVEFYNKYLRN